MELNGLRLRPVWTPAWASIRVPGQRARRSGLGAPLGEQHAEPRTFGWIAVAGNLYDVLSMLDATRHGTLLVEMSSYSD